MSLKKSALVFIGILAVLLCAGCAKLGETKELPLAVTEPTPIPYDRINCDEILGTVFRSPAERTFFEENCSKWPAVVVGDEPAPSATAAPRNEPAECAAIRGKPYESNAQRTFFLQNCSQSTRLTTDASNSDRTDCNQIRGTTYRSNAEREWYNRNCGNQPEANSGQDRTNCNDIRGSSYRSPQERDWFMKNCRD